jgi:hypothetical protein
MSDGLPPIAGMDSPWDRLAFAIKCGCMAVLLCFFLGIEAVSQERLHTSAINPLTGNESARIEINLRYLKRTLEQLLLFIPGLLALASYCTNDLSMRAVVATTMVWILARFVFWIGHAFSAASRRTTTSSQQAARENAITARRYIVRPLSM